MAVTSWRKEGTVAVLSLDNGENRHNPTFIADILADLDAIEADLDCHALVITSSDAKNWSQGIDLAWLGPVAADRTRADEVRAFLHGLNRIFTRILTFPMPVIAAISGHAFGNGAILACACDFRLMRSDRGFFCFPEVDVDIPFLPGMLAIVQKAMPMHLIESLYFSGRRAGAMELEAHHVVTKACEGGEAVLHEAILFAAGFHKGRAVFGEMKRRKHASILQTMAQDDAPIIAELRIMATGR